MRIKNKKERCSIEGCKELAFEIYEDDDVKINFCKIHKPHKIIKDIEGGQIIYKFNDADNITVDKIKLNEFYI